ncbi:hypothetical protein ACV35P_34235, partial [Pseudomonas aeruginosa]
MADPAFHTPLVHEGILAVRGPDAAKFRQGRGRRGCLQGLAGCGKRGRPLRCCAV